MSDHRTLQWATGAGPVILQWPRYMTPDDARDALAAVRIACRAIERLAAASPSFADYGAALQAAMGEERDQ